MSYTEFEVLLDSLKKSNTWLGFVIRYCDKHPLFCLIIDIVVKLR